MRRDRCNSLRIRGLEKDTFIVRSAGSREQQRKYVPQYNAELQPYTSCRQKNGTAECGQRHKMPLISLKKDYLSPVCCGSLIRMIQFRAHARVKR